MKKRIIIIHIIVLSIMPMFLHGASIYKSHLAGLWYPRAKVALQTSIQNLATEAQNRYNASLNRAAIKAIIVPHAGYSYSGTVAASVYRLLDKQLIKRVIILAPDHSVSFTGVALPFFDTIQTPLGKQSVDSVGIQFLAGEQLFNRMKDVFETEHSLEIQLPFIQTYIPHSTIIPLIIGKLSCAQAHRVAQTLIPLIDDNTLVVVSSDFTHYGKRFNYTPFNNHIAYNIRALDSQAIAKIQQGKCKPFASFIEQTGTTICGHYPLEILLSLFEQNTFGSIEPRLIAYDTSGRQEKKYTNSVSYIGLLFTQEKLASLPIEQQLTQQEQRGLLQEARDILHTLFDKSINKELLYPLQSFGVLQHHGAFTTLEKEIKGTQELRGCIGRITTNAPLYKTVAIVTQEAALSDPRFKPVTITELPTLSVKLSVLSPPHRVHSFKDIVVGTHGVILKHGDKSAVFLPEVATEFGWTREQMLEQLSKKAGLSAYAWLDESTQYDVFSSLDIQ